MDYGASEGVYLDVYLKWYDQQKQESVIKSFITGKTLGETGSDLDRMYLIASTITKAFNGDGGTHARYIRLGEPETSAGMLMHLSSQEQRLLIDSLVERRSSLKEEFTGVEQLLRRITGSITEFVNEVGERPLKLSNVDMTVLAIQDGNLPLFQKLLPKVADQISELLIHTAARPGMIGRKMTVLLLAEIKGMNFEAYFKASKLAVNTGDIERVCLLYEQAACCVTELPETYHGDIVGYAYSENRQIAKALLKQATSEQIGSARPYLLHAAAMNDDYTTALELVKKGIVADEVAAEVIYGFQRSPWVIPHLLEQGMHIEPENYRAFHACVNTGNMVAAGALLEHGVDFNCYTEWLERNRRHYPLQNPEALDAVRELCTTDSENTEGMVL